MCLKNMAKADFGYTSGFNERLTTSSAEGLQIDNPKAQKVLDIVSAMAQNLDESFLSKNSLTEKMLIEYPSIDSLLPASYRAGEYDADIALPSAKSLEFLKKELSTGRLSKMFDHLWWAGRPVPPQPLHCQLLRERQVVVTEQMDLHLVWKPGQMYIKPIPRFLLDPRFWDTHLSCHCRASTTCGHQQLRKCALGFLFSYTALVCHESDFSFAKERHLLPPEITWPDWRQLTADILKTDHIYDHIDRRYIYGELRLSRLNKLRYVQSGLAMRGYMPHYQRFGDFVSDNFRMLASGVVNVAIVLTAMQVGLATDLVRGPTFQAVSAGFSVFAMLLPLLVSGFVAMVLLFTATKNIATSAKFKKQRLARLSQVSAS
ncbi:hypothetical protein diail_8806 [Diaporthe ilicicola]|nr:hypothetical protein diail_8806 [Diaporthe ilicicola]